MHFDIVVDYEYNYSIAVQTAQRGECCTLLTTACGTVQRLNYEYYYCCECVLLLTADSSSSFYRQYECSGWSHVLVYMCEKGFFFLNRSMEA